MCRPGHARKRHRESCKGITHYVRQTPCQFHLVLIVFLGKIPGIAALVLSIRLDKLGEKKLNYNPDYFNPKSEIYQNLEWETIHGVSPMQFILIATNSIQVDLFMDITVRNLMSLISSNFNLCFRFFPAGFHF